MKKENHLRPSSRSDNKNNSADLLAIKTGCAINFFFQDQCALLHNGAATEKIPPTADPLLYFFISCYSGVWEILLEGLDAKPEGGSTVMIELDRANGFQPSRMGRTEVWQKDRSYSRYCFQPAIGFNVDQSFFNSPRSQMQRVCHRRFCALVNISWL